MKPPRPRPPSAGRPGKPTPVRAFQEAPEPTKEPDVAAENASIVIDGAPWQVVVGGAALGGGAVGPARLLMLCFTNDDETGAREAWVVGEGLREVSHDRLVAAFRNSKPRPERRDPPGFFEDLGGRRRR